MLRSRVLSVQQDEVPSKIFKTTKRQRAQQIWISRLQVEEDIVTEQDAIESVLFTAFRFHTYIERALKPFYVILSGDIWIA